MEVETCSAAEVVMDHPKGQAATTDDHHHRALLAVLPDPLRRSATETVVGVGRHPRAAVVASGL